jgi:hypothetical protein
MSEIRNADGELVPWDGEFVRYRQPDAVRAAALANAVDLCAHKTADNYEDVIEIAKAFEAYLTGEEANG